jgi:hypothetical protein
VNTTAGVYALFTTLSVLTLTPFSVIGVIAQERPVNVNALVDELQRGSDELNRMDFVFWMPPLLWRHTLAQSASMTGEDIEDFVKVLKPYTLVAVVAGSIGPFGGVTYVPEETLLTRVWIKDGYGTLYGPLSGNTIDADTEMFLAMMKPMFVNLLGPMGRNMHFFLFPAKTDRGEHIADPMQIGSFSIVLNEVEYRWRLPLSSLVPAKICPVCHEELKGTFGFCPWDGSKLPALKE